MLFLNRQRPSAPQTVREEHLVRYLAGSLVLVLVDPQHRLPLLQEDGVQPAAGDDVVAEEQLHVHVVEDEVVHAEGAKGDRVFLALFGEEVSWFA